HTHTYYQEETSLVVNGDKEANGKPVVTWEWIGSEEEGYTGAKVTLHCVDPLCNDYEGSAIVYDSDKNKIVTVTPNPDPGSCTDGGFIAYKAEATNKDTQITYVSENEAKHVGKVNRHEYVFDWEHARLYNLTDYDNAYAEVVKKCEAEHHDVNRDGQREVTVSSDRVEFVGTQPTCEADGEGYYNFIFEDPDIPAADIEAGKNIVSSNKIVVDKLNHKWKAVSANWEGGSYAEKPKSASLNLVCQNDETHTAVLTVNAQGITEERTEESVTYTAIGYYEDQQVDFSITYASHTDHEWTVSFNWVTVSVNLVDTKVTATAYCLTGGEKEELLVKVTEEVTGNLKTYTAKATDPAGKEWTESKTIDLKTGEEVDHEHVWSEPVWDWTGTTSENAVAKATFTCSVSGNHSVTLDATKIDVEKRTAKKITYKAYVTGPDDKEYTSTYVYDIASGSGKTSEENEIDIADGKYTVIGIEEEYYYTSVAIKPSFRIVDNERDVVLAKGVDYTVSYKNNKKLGATATVKIKGKGNYAGVDESIKFTIKDPKELAEGETLASGKIKKVTVSEKSFTYNGKAQYPTTITVEMKDGKVFTFKHDGDGEYTNETEGDTTVVLSFCNNKDKGTATVLVTGAEKSKKASYKIAAAEIGTATIEVEGATWGVKAEQAKVIATLGEDAIELIPGQDFKVSYKAKNAGENAGEAKITGKGNFKKSIKKSYNVEALELTEENIIITATANKKAKVVVVDNAGNTVGKKLYSYELTDAEGNPVAAKAKLAAGTVTAKVTATGNVTGEATAEATVTTASISKVKVKVDKNFTKTYTGEQIKLDADDFGAGKIEVTGLTYGEDFEIVGYKNNIKKGSMTVTIQGIGEKCGTKTFKVKIAAKSLNK
ncbi:MAG: hypothetical protein IKH94_01940, partial [Eubacterium sp.]|nr:hypothetical protein [Eubacterium sp.]